MVERILQFARLVLGVALLAGTAVAQTPTPLTTVYFYSGSNLIYSCTALAVQPRSLPGFSGSTTNSGVITVSAASNANPVSFTATAHGLDFPSAATIAPVITISGGTGNWTPINGSFVATITSANAFTIAVDSTSFGALTGTLLVTTAAPKDTEAVWLVKNYVYSGANLIFSGTGYAPAGAGTTSRVGPSNAMNQICANRATLAYQ